MIDINLVHGMQFRDFDLNLLRYLSVLLEEESVSRAAVRVGLSQSAMSHALRRIRDLLDDPVLVSSDGRMRKTPRMIEIADQLQQMMEIADAVSRKPEAQKIGSINSEISIFSTEDFFHQFGPAIVADLRRRGFAGPIELRGVRRITITKYLESGQFAFAVMPTGYAPESLIQKRIFTDRFVCLARKGHPVLDAGCNLETYLAFPHIVVKSMDWGAPSPLDLILQMQGMRRRTEATVFNFSTALEILRHGDCILTLPSLAAEAYGAPQDLIQFDCPLKSVSLESSLLWHERFARDASSTGVRDVLFKAVAARLSELRGAPD